MMEEVAYFEGKGKMDLNFLDQQVKKLVSEGKNAEAQKLLSRYTRDFAGATMLKWEELEHNFWGKFGAAF
jgi:hypothetical protein